LINYADITKDICCFFSKKLEECRKFGIKDVIIDPGFGFAKTLDQNYEILKNLMYFKTIESLLLVGLSRKSMIYKKLEINPEEALNGTTALHMFSLLQGANILRVHDVKAAKETIELFKHLYP
jgi:dihydropteroate synthase